jgi:RNA-directed DNA polymerase
MSPLLSNIYLHVLDDVWTRRSPQLGTLVRYADDFGVMCDTKAACERAEPRVREILARLGLELHPDKTRRVDLSWGREGIDRPLRDTLAQLNPVLRGWGAYFRTGNAAIKFGQVDDYVAWRLKRLLRQRPGRNLGPGHAAQWTPAYFHALGLHRLRGTIQYPEAA